MNRLVIVLAALLIVAPAQNVEARRGCCSHHGGVCGCSCCDGSPLSSKCSPYYPQCNKSEKKASKISSKSNLRLLNKSNESAQADTVTIVTPGRVARLCPNPNCGINEHITRIPKGTTLEVEGYMEVLQIEDYILSGFQAYRSNFRYLPRIFPAGNLLQIQHHPHL